MSETALATHQLCKSYGDVRAVDGLDLTVPKGALYGFVGLNGAGKTTTLRILMGLIRPTSGTITLAGETRDCVAPHQLRRVTAMIDGPSFFGRLTGRENLAALARLSGPVAKSHIESVLAEVDLVAAANRRVSGYSLGMKQRLGLALALLGAPEIVILDEPTNGLDPEGVAELRESLARLHRERGLTVLISSHLLGEVEKLATRIGVIRAGRLVAEGSLAELLAPTGSIRVEATPRESAARALSRFGVVRNDGAALVLDLAPGPRPDVALALTNAECRVDAIVPQRLSLEQLVLGSENGA